MARALTLRHRMVTPRALDQSPPVGRTLRLFVSVVRGAVETIQRLGSNVEQKLRELLRRLKLANKAQWPRMQTRRFELPLLGSSRRPSAKKKPTVLASFPLRASRFASAVSLR